MRVIRSGQFVGQRAWDALDIAVLNGISVRLHWTDQPYIWHVNDGEEVFVVLAGQVKMLYRNNDQEDSVLLGLGDIFFADKGTEHVAHPQGIARVLVIEKSGSI